MSQNINKMYSLSEIVKEFGVPYQTLYRWVRLKKVKADQNVNRFKVNEWYISQNEWLNVPAYIRSRYIKKGDEKI